MTRVVIPRKAGESFEPAVEANTQCVLTFNGATNTTLSAGETVLYDPMYFLVAAFEKLMVSLHTTDTAVTATRHWTAREVPFMSLLPGDKPKRTLARPSCLCRSNTPTIGC